MYDDLPALVPANPSGAGPGGFPPEAIRPGGFGAGAPHAGAARFASRYTTPIPGHAGLAYDDAGFSYPKQTHDFGSAPDPFEHNPWLAGRSGASAAYHQPRGRPHPSTPYQPAAAMDADWPQHGHDFGMSPRYGMDGGPPEGGFGAAGFGAAGFGAGGFGAGGFGEQQFVGGFAQPQEDDDDTEPVIPQMPRSMSAPNHARSHSHSPGFGAANFADFGQAPPQGFGQTPPAGQMTLAPGHDWWRRAHSASAGATPQTAPLPLSAHPGYASGPRHQYKRPGDWRRDFTMPRKVGMGERLGLTRVLSIGRVFQGEGVWPTLCTPRQPLNSLLYS